jgi:hypothetical protein
MEVSKTLIAILILVLVFIAVIGVWTNLTKDTGTAPSTASAEGKLYVRVVKPVQDTGNLKLVIEK